MILKSHFFYYVKYTTNPFSNNNKDYFYENYPYMKKLSILVITLLSIAVTAQDSQNLNNQKKVQHTNENLASMPVTFTGIGSLCINAGIQTGLSGGLPIGGYYHGTGITDDGNGMTYTFDPSATNVGPGIHYNAYTVGNETASDWVEVFSTSAYSFTAPNDLCVNAGVQTNLGGASNLGGIYSGPGVVDNGDGLTYSFDPALAGIGIHTITYTQTNSNGCTGSISDDVEVFGFTVSFIVTTPVYCIGGSNGTLTAIATGDSGNYTYTWNTGSTGPSITNLSAGDYSVTVEDVDGFGCILVDVPFTLTDGADLEANIVATTPTCISDDDGVLTATPSGGILGNYTYLWNTGSTAASITNLVAGDYNVTITDWDGDAVYGCSKNVPFTLNNDIDIQGVITVTTPIACLGDTDGGLTVAPNGGVLGNYTYLWNTGSTAASITNLTAGDYNVTITDWDGGTVFGCSNTVTFNLNDGSEIIADAPANVTAICNYTLPPLTVGNYFDATGGTGTPYFEYDYITADITLYVYAVNALCTDENSFTITITTPEIEVQGNNTLITDGDITPDIVDNTLFENTYIGSFTERTFTIENNGNEDLILSGSPLISIIGSTDFTITADPISPVTSGGGTTTFTVRYTPSTAGTINNAILAIVNNTCEEIDYTFSIQGSSLAPILLSPTVYLQGAYINPNIGEEALMRDDLRLATYLPATSPYADLLTCNAAVFNTGGTSGTGLISDDIADWVWVELRDKNDNTTIIAGTSALLQRDGNIVGINGISPLSFNADADNYYIAIKHRNHLGIISANTFALTTNTTVIDFTDATSPITFGTDAQTTFGMPINTLGMWAGDANGDGQLNYLGAASDIPSIRSQVFNDPNNSVFGGLPVASYQSTGYYSTDIDLDGKTAYSGATSDVLIIRNNTFNNPSNSVFGGLPVATYLFTQQLPEGAN